MPIQGIPCDSVSPKNALAGSTARKAGDNAQAIALFRQAVRIRCAHAPYRLAIGQALLEAGDAIGARKSFEHAVFLEPRSAAAAPNLAAALRTFGEDDAAQRMNRRALVLLLRRAACSAVAGTLGTIAVLPAIPAGASRGARGIATKRWRFAAHWREALGLSEFARSAWFRAHRADPDDVATLLDLARVMLVEDQIYPALKHVEAAFALAPASPSSRVRCGQVLSRMARHDEALAVLEPDSAPVYETPDALAILAWTRFRAGRTQ